MPAAVPWNTILLGLFPVTCQQMPNPERRSTRRALKHQQTHAKGPLCARAGEGEHKVDQIVVGCRVKEPCCWVEARQPVPRAWHKLEELRRRVQEVEDLRREEEEERLAEVAQDASDAEGHASKVSERVANKHLRGVPVEGEQRKRGRHQREHQVGREEVPLLDRALLRLGQLHEIVQQEGESKDQRLPRLEPVHASENIDGVGAEAGEEHHVDLVGKPELEELGRPKGVPQGPRDHDGGSARVGDEEGQGGEKGERELDSPRDVEDVVREPEEEHEADRRQRRVVVHEPRVCDDLPLHVALHAAGCEGEEAARVVVVKLLEADDADKEDDSDREPEGLGDPLLARLRPFLVDVKPKESPGLHPLRQKRDETLRCDEAQGTDAGTDEERGSNSRAPLCSEVREGN
mmetsp:Transcript_6929/g.16698  ORF Transcript_6929/g.16698 Transcript_6929/m.16698 type:complete len:405 (-) Transcript_6929:244-1458(-)